MAVAKHLLVVDDDAFFRDILARFLRNCGYRVECCSNGYEALKYLRSGERPHLILLDLRMDGLDGWQFRQLQREDSDLADIPVVVLSGVAGYQSDQADLEVAACLEKPCSLDLLLSTIERLTGNGTLVEEAAAS